MGKNKKLQYIQILTIVVSLLLHLCLWLGLGQMDPTWSTAEHVPIEVDYIPVAEKEKQIVEIDPNQKKLEKLKSRVNRLSKHATRVKKETLARATGAETRNQKVSRSKRNPSKNKRKKLSPQMKELLKPSPSGSISAEKSINENLMSHMPQFSRSTSSDYIPNVARADATALNADQFKFFSYYSRLKNKLYPRWTGQLRKMIRNSSSMQIYKLGKKPRLTQLKVVLSKKGYIEKINVSKSSGYKSLDQIAINAFKKSSPILNPPAGMLHDDGLIYITYGFNVQFNPRHIVRKKP